MRCTLWHLLGAESPQSKSKEKQASRTKPRGGCLSRFGLFSLRMCNWRENRVEMDETYVGGRRKGTKRGRPTAGVSHKTCVIGVVERSTETRNGRVLCLTAESASQNNLRQIAAEKILPESTVFTDDWTGYNGLATVGNYTHKRINHAEKIYVVSDGVHSIRTNTIEGFWSLVKRGIGGVYHAVSKKYLQSYLDEYSFRYNRRDQGNLIFTSILEKVFERAV